MSMLNNPLYSVAAAADIDRDDDEESWQVLEQLLAFAPQGTCVESDSDDDSAYEDMNLDEYFSTVMNTGTVTAQLFRMCQELCVWKKFPSVSNRVNADNAFKNFVEVYNMYEKYVDVNRPNDQPPYNTMLMVACSVGHSKLARFLLEQGADIHSQDDEGNTPLIHAVRSESVELVQMLFDHFYPNSNQRSSSGFTAANSTLCIKNWNILRLLHEYSCPSLHFDVDQDYCDPMLCSVLKSFSASDLQKALYLCHWNVNTRNTNGRTLLMCDCMDLSHNALSRIQVLLSCADIDINLQDHGGYTALMFACQTGNLSVVRLLLTETSELNVDSQNNSGESAMIIAASRGYVDIVELLITLGHADASLRTKNGLTASAYALMGGFHQKYLELLE